MKNNQGAGLPQMSIRRKSYRLYTAPVIGVATSWTSAMFSRMMRPVFKFVEGLRMTRLARSLSGLSDFSKEILAGLGIALIGLILTVIAASMI